MTKEDIARQLGIPTESVDDVLKFAELLKTANSEVKAEISIILHTLELACRDKNKKRH